MKKKAISIMAVTILLATVLCSLSASATVLIPNASESKGDTFKVTSGDITINFHITSKEDGSAIRGAACIVCENFFGMRLDSDTTNLWGNCETKGNYLDYAFVKSYGLHIRVSKLGYKTEIAKIYPVYEGSTHNLNLQLQKTGDSAIKSVSPRIITLIQNILRI